MSRPMRKDDPGELFPWAQLADSGIGLWPEPRALIPAKDAVPALLAQFGYDPEAPLEKTVDGVPAPFPSHPRGRHG